MILAKKNRILAVLMAVAVVTGLSSCLKNNNNPAPEAFTYAFFANLATPTYKISVFQNNADLLGGEGMEFGTVRAGRLKPGPAKFDFKRLGSDTLLSSYNTTLDTLRYFSTFIYGSQTSGVETYHFREDFSNNSTSKAHVRFFNMVEGSEPVDFYIGETKLSSSRMYEDFLSGSYNSFTQIDPNEVSITVKNAAGTELAKISNVSLAVAGGVYTVVYAGTQGDTGNRKPAIKTFSH
ncbi:DUF4397 domain-containing protein [Chitinophaga lutea]|nr:DUF4397 domain-containing protein [Chitinophaga lutea]